MTRTQRKVVTRLLIIGANLATIAVIVKLTIVSPIGGAIVVACVFVVLAAQRREIASFIRRLGR